MAALAVAMAVIAIEEGTIVVESPIPTAMRRFLFPDPDAKLPAWLT
jgi:hypothetical protein